MPEPTTNKKGKPLNYIVYNSAESLFVDDMEHVGLQKILADKGYQVNSPEMGPHWENFQTAVQYGTTVSCKLMELCLVCEQL